MRRVVVDASALAAVAFGEPNRRVVAERLDGAVVCAPRLLTFELANVAWKKMKRDPKAASSILRGMAEVLDERAGIEWHDVNANDVALVAMATGCTAYDAAYIWLAGSLGADLVTEDLRLARLTAAAMS